MVFFSQIFLRTVKSKTTQARPWTREDTIVVNAHAYYVRVMRENDDNDGLYIYIYVFARDGQKDNDCIFWETMEDSNYNGVHNESAKYTDTQEYRCNVKFWKFDDFALVIYTENVRNSQTL